MLARAPKGTKDILPSEIDSWYYLEDTIKEILQNYCYREIRTPVFEYTDLFIRSIGEATDIVNKEMFTFQDRKGRSLSLRPEGTAPVARAYIEHHIGSQNPVNKLFYLGNMFRSEKPQAGRFRQFSQFGAEALGSALPVIDAEIIAVSLSVCKKIGLSGLDLMVNSVGCRHCRPQYLKVLQDYFRDKRSLLCADCQQRYEKNPLRILDCKNNQCRAIVKDCPSILDYLCEDCADHFHGLKGYLDNLGIPYLVNHLLVRGLDYYTKTAFEIMSDALGAQNAIIAGGRYDYLVEELGGSPTPAVGFAAGMERILLTIEKQGIEVPAWQGIRVFIATTGSEETAYALTLANHLRDEGITVEMDYSAKSLKAQMRMANKLNVPAVLILGSDELKEKKVVVKDMLNGGQEIISVDGILDYLKINVENK